MGRAGGFVLRKGLRQGADQPLARPALSLRLALEAVDAAAAEREYQFHVRLAKHELVGWWHDILHQLSGPADLALLRHGAFPS
jgi:hypothetical protein